MKDETKMAAKYSTVLLALLIIFSETSAISLQGIVTSVGLEAVLEKRIEDYNLISGPGEKVNMRINMRILDAKELQFIISERDLIAEGVVDKSSHVVPLMTWKTAFIANIHHESIEGLDGSLYQHNIKMNIKSIAKIYSGAIEYWDDDEIAQQNLDTVLPHAKITPISRVDSAKETEMLINTFSAVSPEWKQRMNASEKENIRYNYRLLSEKEAYTEWGMMGLLMSTPYSIGYVAEAVLHVLENQLSIGIHPISSNKVSILNDSFEFCDSCRYEELQSCRRRALEQPTLSMKVFFYIPRSVQQYCKEMYSVYKFYKWLALEMQEHEKHHYYFGKIIAKKSTGVRQIEKNLNCLLWNATCDSTTLHRYITTIENSKQKSDRIRENTATIAAASTIAGLIFIGLGGYFLVRGIRIMTGRQRIVNYTWLIDRADIKLLTNEKKMGVSSSKDMTKESSRISDVRHGSIGLVPFGQQSLPRLSTVTWNSSSGQLPEDMDKTSHGSSANDSDDWIHATIKVGQLGDTTVCLQRTQLESRALKPVTQKLIHQLISGVSNPYVLPLYGLTVIGLGEMYMVTEYCAKGSLQNVLLTAKYNLDNNFKFTLALDVARGMEYLHGKDIVHGNLKTSCCYIDERWMVKVGDWPVRSLLLAEGVQWGNDETHASMLLHASKKFWTAPEILNSEDPESCTKKSDVYSYGILLQEIFSREYPYSEMSDFLSPEEIIEGVQHEGLRPTLTSDTPAKVQHIIKQAWAKDPDERPPFYELIKMSLKANPTKKSVLDCMMEAVESYVVHLEEKVNERTAELAKAMKGAEELLHKMLPPTIAQKLSKGQEVAPELFESVTIYFSDIVGFTSISAKSTPQQVISLLNELYTLFDSVIDKYDVYKVETIGDAYMVISGLPKRNGIKHARNIANLALDFIAVTATFKIPHLPDRDLQIRAGMASGPVMAGVVGRKMPRYCLFGDTVNTSSRMESTSSPMRIQISKETTDLLEQLGGFKTKLRGQVEIKGKGMMTTHWLLDRTSAEESEA